MTNCHSPLSHSLDEEFELSFEDGNAFSSSRKAEVFARKAFEKSSWTSGKHTSGEKKYRKPPHLIFFRFPTPKKVTKVSFMPGFKSWRTTGPSKYQIVASTDQECTNQECQQECKCNWDILMTDESGNQFWKRDQVKTGIIPVEKQNLYYCYGIRVKKVPGGRQTVISKIRMWHITE
jgi:hypothetical protein